VSATARAVGRGYAVRIPQGVENENIAYSHFGSGGGITALLRCWGFPLHRHLPKL